jgi:hypothetical protein
VYREGVFSSLGKWLGMQDVEIGDPYFDRDFVIKGNSEGHLRKFFANPELRDLVRRQPRIHLLVKDDEGWFGTQFPEGVDELYFSCIGVIKDLRHLQSLFELFAVCLHQLCHIGSAYEDDPEVLL